MTDRLQAVAPREHRRVVDSATRGINNLPGPHQCAVLAERRHAEGEQQDAAAEERRGIELQGASSQVRIDFRKAQVTASDSLAAAQRSSSSLITPHERHNNLTLVDHCQQAQPDDNLFEPAAYG
jgi:hypothetical protein